MSVMNPSPATLAWIARVGGGPIAAISRLEGGVQAETHVVDLSLPGGVIRRLVLRRFDARDALPARREAAHLAGLSGSGLPVAELVAADTEAKEADLPATHQTRLPGTANLDPAFALKRLDQLAAVLARIHLVPYQLVGQLSDYTSRVVEV